MKEILDHLAYQQAHFGLHPFLQRLERNEPLRHVLPFASYLSFWVFAFQDVLRLNDTRMQDPEFRVLARHHRAEEAGHDRWFVADMLKIEGSTPDLRELFSAAHAPTRDVAYALTAEVFQAKSDMERIALLLALEYSSHIFFEKIAAYFERQGVNVALQYFARHHIDAEERHEIFEERMTERLLAMELDARQRDRCLSLVNRCFAAFDALLDGLEERLRQSELRAVRPSGLKVAQAREERLRDLETTFQAQKVA